MESPALENIRIKLLYDKTKAPVENLSVFFNTVKTLRYEWVKNEAHGQINYYLDSAWQNEIGLRDITLNFQQTFTQHLIDISMSEFQNQDYMTLLKDCKEVLRQANHYFSIPFHDILIITRPVFPEDEMLIVNFDSLPHETKLSIARCYDLIRTFFRNLEECINDEIKEYERKEYVRDKSTYAWTGDKNELSEIALGLFLSGKIKRRDGKEPMKSTFARELAAFLGIDKLDFDQNINSLMTRTASSRTPFLDSLSNNMEQYFIQHIDNQG